MRAYHKMAIVDDNVFVVGGFHGDINYHKHCRKYNLTKKQWSHVTPMNMERCYVSVAVIGRKIYAIGGYNGRFRLNTAEYFNIDTNQVRGRYPMIVPYIGRTHCHGRSATSTSTSRRPPSSSSNSMAFFDETSCDISLFPCSPRWNPAVDLYPADGVSAE